MAIPKHTQLIETTIFLRLMLDVFPDGRFVPSNGRNIVTPGPKMLVSKIFAMTHKIPLVAFDFLRVHQYIRGS